MEYNDYDNRKKLLDRIEKIKDQKHLQNIDTIIMKLEPTIEQYRMEDNQKQINFDMLREQTYHSLRTYLDTIEKTKRIKPLPSKPIKIKKKIFKINTSCLEINRIEN